MTVNPIADRRLCLARPLTPGEARSIAEQQDPIQVSTTAMRWCFDQFGLWEPEAVR